MVLPLHPTSRQPSPLLPVRHWDHLEVGLVPHNMVNEVELGTWSAGGGWGGSQLGSGAPHSGDLFGSLVGHPTSTQWQRARQDPLENTHNFGSSGSLKRGGWYPGRKRPL